MYSISIQNMSQVNSEEICIYNDESVIEAFKLESAVLKQEEGNAGTLTIKVPPTNVGYSAFETLTTMAIVRKKGEDYPYDEPKVIWIGRLLEMKIDFDNNKEIVFEGAYNFLMDTIQPPYHAKTDITLWAAYMISNHNTMVQASGQGWKTINVGVFDTAINPTETTDLYTDYDTTLDMINNVCEGWNAHPRFRYGYSQTYHCWQLILDLYSTYNSEGDRPQIAFGENLTDYTREYKNEETATVVIPRGKKYTNQEWDVLPEGTEPAVPDGVDKYRTIYSVNNQSIYCYPNPNDTEAVANLQRYGFICKTVDFSNEIDYNALKASGEKYLRDQKWDKTTITINGFDLKLMDYNAIPIKIGEMVHCVSRPHGLDYNYPCTAIEENLMEVGSTTYVLGFPDDRYMTDSSRKSDEKLRDAITQAVSREKILQQNTYDYTNSSIEDYDTQTVQGYVQDLEDEIAAISFDPSEAVEEAKTNALQLLNIYDEEKNPERKGYVHFVKETADYSSEGTLTLSDLRARVNKYHANYSPTNLNNLFNHIETLLTNPESNLNETVFVMLGPQDYQTAITIFSTNVSYRLSNGCPYFYNYTYSNKTVRVATYYNASYFGVDGCFWSWGSGSSNCRVYTGSGSSGDDYKYFVSTYSDENGFFDPFTTDETSKGRRHYAYATEGNFFHLPDGYKMYTSRDLYPSSSSLTPSVTKNLIPDPVSDLLSLSQLKQKIMQKVPSSNNLTTFLNRMDEVMTLSETGRGFISVIVKTENGVDNWNRFKVSLIMNYYRNSTSYTQFGFGYGPSDGALRSFYGSTGVASYVPYYGLVEVVDSESRVSVSSSDYGQGSSTDHTSLIDSIGSYSAIIPSLADILSTGMNSYVSVPLYKYTSLSNIWGETVITPNLVSHVSNPQDHITEIVISDKADYMANDANLWRWNKEGLYYLNGGYNGATLPDGEYGSNTDNLRLALTKNGQIVADRITAGQLDAGIIRTGVLMGNPAVPGDPEGDADFKINVNTGTVLAKKARLVFSNVRQHSGTISDPDNSLTEFAYLSNEPINRYVNVSAKTSKDWMMIIGSSFGVDKYGRAYMREGHIGGDGGVFDIFAYNESATDLQWLSTTDLGNNTYLHKWKCVVNIASDSYRPAITPELATFRFRLGYYDANNQIQFESGLTSFNFEAGTAPKSFVIEINTQTTSADQTPQPTEYPYYDGQLFPVWYVKDANGEYVEDNVAYKQMTGVDSSYQVKILGYLDTEETLPQYSSWTDERYQISGIAGQGAINIGPGYLDNGNTGQSQSFYLGGINRSATVANRTANDWRFTVGSRLGVTDEGNLYANNATLSNVWASGSITGSSFSAGYIPPISFNATNPIEANYFLSMFDWKFWSESDGGMFSSTTRLSIIYTGSDPSGRDKSGIMERDISITFKPSVYEFRGSGSHYEDGRRAASQVTVTYSRTGSDRQDFIINTSDWNVPDDGWTFADKVFILIDINNSSQTFYLEGQNQIKSNVNDPGDGTIYWLTGAMTMLKIDSQSGRRAVNCGADFIGSGWLGGQYMPWAKLYVDTIINTSSKIYKHDIEGLDARYDKLLDILRPVRFRFNKDHYDDGDLYHTGFILEELGECMKIAGIKPEEFAAYDPNPDGVGGGIRYSEFIPLIVDQLQKLKRENEDLKRQLYEKGILDD